MGVVVMGTEDTSLPLSNGAPLNGLKILVVDDEADGRELLHFMLSQSGATVIAVESVKEALTIMHRFLPDILISDIGMPVQDGYALIHQIRSLESGKRVAALALTAYASSDEHNRTKAAGFDAYLCKPVEPAKLVKTVERLAGRGGNP
jgi:CheY-like chemotaxis protein